MCSSTAIASRPMLLRDRSAAPPPPRSSVAISSGSPATESGVGRLDLNELPVRHPQAAFKMRIASDSMRGAGICDGDLALVDCAITAAHGHVVIAIVNDEFVCRRLMRRAQEVRHQCTGRCCPIGSRVTPRNCRSGAS